MSACNRSVSWAICPIRVVSIRASGYHVGVDRTSVAQGLGWIAIVAVAGVVARAAVVGLANEPSGRTPVCTAPVEWVGPRGARLACAADVELRGCELRAGDRVSIGCQVVPGGMAASMRLLAGVPLDLNRASATDLELLDGIGPKLAEAIVRERARAPFAHVDDLLRVRGIGPVRLEHMRPFVTVP